MTAFVDRHPDKVNFFHLFVWSVGPSCSFNVLFVLRVVDMSSARKYHIITSMYGYDLEFCNENKKK